MEAQLLVAQAIADLVARTGSAPAEIELIGLEQVTWPDASLGCPQPGMAYAQVLQEGWQIRLRCRGQVYEYHSGPSRPPFLAVTGRM